MSSVQQTATCLNCSKQVKTVISSLCMECITDALKKISIAGDQTPGDYISTTTTVAAPVAVPTIPEAVVNKSCKMCGDDTKSSDLCTSCLGDKLICKGSKWNGSHFGTILLEDPTYCMGVFAKQWILGKETLRFRKWIAKLSRLEYILISCSSNIPSSGKYKEKKTFKDISDDSSYCNYLGSIPLTNASLKSLKSYLFVKDFLELQQFV